MYLPHFIKEYRKKNYKIAIIIMARGLIIIVKASIIKLHSRFIVKAY